MTFRVGVYGLDVVGNSERRFWFTRGIKGTWDGCSHSGPECKLSLWGVDDQLPIKIAWDGLEFL